SFKEIPEDRKWCLSSKRNVEDVLYAYTLKLKAENPAHSFIIDTSDDNIKNLFNENEWEEIMNVNKKVVQPLTNKYESLKNRLMQPHAKGWYAVNIWGMLIDKAFLNVPDIDLVRDETCSVASINNYEYGGIEVAKTCRDPHERKQLGDSLKLTKLLKDIFH
ncbi:9815_t:CDS:2, partial [Ambispora gerdemannii]